MHENEKKNWVQTGGDARHWRPLGSANVGGYLFVRDTVKISFHMLAYVKQIHVCAFFLIFRRRIFRTLKSPMVIQCAICHEHFWGEEKHFKNWIKMKTSGRSSLIFYHFNTFNKNL